jgi:E3 ubiquitin-protein ligase HUWE1
VMVDRDDVLNQSFHMISNYTPRQLLRGSFHVTFNNEPGMDAGGLTREWLLMLTRSIFKPAYALFSLTGDGVTYQPNPHSGANPEHLDYFRFIGRLVAKAICDNVLLDVHFTRSFYKHILRAPISFSDLEAFDKEYYKSLNLLLQNSIEDLGVELNFTVTANVFGTEVTSSLVEDGENVPVTDENKAEYVRLIAHHCLTTSFQKQVICISNIAFL